MLDFSRYSDNAVTIAYMLEEVGQQIAEEGRLSATRGQPMPDRSFFERLAKVIVSPKTQIEELPGLLEHFFSTGYNAVSHKPSKAELMQ